MNLARRSKYLYICLPLFSAVAGATFEPLVVPNLREVLSANEIRADIASLRSGLAFLEKLIAEYSNKEKEEIEASNTAMKDLRSARAELKKCEDEKIELLGKTLPPLPNADDRAREAFRKAFSEVRRHCVVQEAKYEKLVEETGERGDEEDLIRRWQSQADQRKKSIEQKVKEFKELTQNWLSTKLSEKLTSGEMKVVDLHSSPDFLTIGIREVLTGEDFKVSMPLDSPLDHQVVNEAIEIQAIDTYHYTGNTVVDAETGIMSPERFFAGVETKTTIKPTELFNHFAGRVKLENQ